MHKTLRINNTEINYILRKSRKSKRIRLTVKPGGLVTVTMPWHTPERTGLRFLEDKAAWAIKTAEKAKEMPEGGLRGTPEEYKKHKVEALAKATALVERFNVHYGFKYNNIRIKNTKGRWGSCSADKNLNFHYKIIFLSDTQAEYLVVHELCHLKEMNHSSRFWDLVGDVILDYKVVRKTLKNIG